MKNKKTTLTLVSEFTPAQIINYEGINLTTSPIRAVCIYQDGAWLVGLQDKKDMTALRAYKSFNDQKAAFIRFEEILKLIGVSVCYPITKEAAG